MQKADTGARPTIQERTSSSVEAASQLARPGGGGMALLLLGILLAAWELGVRWQQVPPYILPAPTQIFQTLAANPGMYARASLLTLAEALLGLLLGASLGVGTALLLGIWPRLEQGVMTLAIFIKSTPLVAIAPLLTIWLGFGMFPKIIITALLTFFPVLVNMVSGLNSTDPARLDMLRSLSASRRETLRYVRLPEIDALFFRRPQSQRTASPDRGGGRRMDRSIWGSWQDYVAGLHQPESAVLVRGCIHPIDQRHPAVCHHPRIGKKGGLLEPLNLRWSLFLSGLALALIISSALLTGCAPTQPAAPTAQPDPLTFMAGYRPQANLPLWGCTLPRSRGFSLMKILMLRSNTRLAAGSTCSW